MSIETRGAQSGSLRVIRERTPKKNVQAWRRILARPRVIVALACIVIVVGGAIVAPWVGANPNAFEATERLQPPSFEHLFGTDNLGRDVLSRTLFGARASLTVGIITSILVTVVGVTVGVCSAMFRWVDVVVMRIVDGVMSFPIIVLALAMAAILGARLGTVILALVIVLSPGMARIVRSSALVASELPMIDAARAIGSRQLRILWKYVLPHCLTPVLVQAAITFTVAVLVESALSFIGAGLPPDVASWGGALSEARSYLTSAVWMWGFPGLALVATVLSVNVIIDVVRDVLDPRDGGH